MTMDSSGGVGLFTPASRRALAHIQRLLSEEAPGWRKRQVCAYERWMLGQPALGAIRKEPGHERFGPEAGHQTRLLQAPLCKRHLVVDEVPIAAADQPDVGLHHDDPAAGTEDPQGDSKLIHDLVPGGKMLEIVAHERGPE